LDRGYPTRQYSKEVPSFDPCETAQPMQARRWQIVNCPHCGVENPVSETTCRSCSRNLVLYIGPAHNLPRRFGLGALMVLVAVVAPGLALLRDVPFLGVLILLLLPAAAIRTAAAVSQSADDLRPLNLDQKIQVFFGSIGVMVGVLTLAFLTFFAICIPTGALIGFHGLPFAIGLGGVAAIYVAYRMLRSLWPYRG
jgi:ribosomal protein L40E